MGEPDQIVERKDTRAALDRMDRPEDRVDGLGIGRAAIHTGKAGFQLRKLFFGPFMLRIWCAVNVLACFWLARLALDGKKA